MVADLGALEKYVWWLVIAAHPLLAFRMWRSGLHRTYRFFFGYLIFRFARAVALSGVPFVVNLVVGQPNVPFGTEVYRYIWILTEPLMWLAYALVVFELYSLVFQKYPGIATLSRWVVLSGLTMAVIVSCASLVNDLSNPGEQYPKLRIFLAVVRGVHSSLALFLLFISLFLAWYPVPLSRNVVIHCIAYATYFLSHTALFLARNLGGSEVTQVTNIVLSGMNLVCLLVWITFLTPQGETRMALTRRSWVPGEEERLVQQLASINSSLLRAARK